MDCVHTSMCFLLSDLIMLLLVWHVRHHIERVMMTKKGKICSFIVDWLHSGWAGQTSGAAAKNKYNQGLILNKIRLLDEGGSYKEKIGPIGVHALPLGVRRQNIVAILNGIIFPLLSLFFLSFFLSPLLFYQKEGS